MIDPTLAARLTQFEEDVRHREAHGPHEASGLVEESRELVALFNAAEARHVAKALDETDFAFEEAQAALGVLIKDFARIVRDLIASSSFQFSAAQAQELAERAFLAERCPLTSTADLGVIRASRLAIASRRRALGARA